MDRKELLVNEKMLANMIYEIRGKKVMLDFELVEIYGYETKRFNEQVKNNIARFDDDFMFQLTKVEFDNILKSKKSATSWGGRRKLPKAFTEQGIYMLMTILNGDLAVKQSKSLVRLYKAMKDFIIESKTLTYTTNKYIENKFSNYDKRFEVIENKLDIVMDNFIDPSMYKEVLIFDGEKIESDVAFQRIYSLAKYSIIVIDNYINIKTLQLLKACRDNVSITICSDNVAKNKLEKGFIDDFKNDTGIDIVLKPTNNKIYDRYIVLDYKTNSKSIYHCGTSSKDGGNKIFTIMKVENNVDYHRFIDDIL